MGIDATIVDNWSDGKRLHVVGTLAFSGNYATAGVTLNFGTAGVRSDRAPVWVDAPLYRGFLFEYAAGASAREGKLKVFGAGSVAATGVLTHNATAPSNGDAVVIGSRTYTFKTALTPAANEVLIGADADTAITNLKDAINLTGTPGTQYGAATTINADVSAVVDTGANTVTVTAKIAGTAANSIATTETSANLSWGASTLANGANSTPIGTELSAAAFPTNLTSFAVPFYAIFYQLQ